MKYSSNRFDSSKKNFFSSEYGRHVILHVKKILSLHFHTVITCFSFESVVPTCFWGASNISLVLPLFYYSIVCPFNVLLLMMLGAYWEGVLTENKTRWTWSTSSTDQRAVQWDNAEEESGENLRSQRWRPAFEYAWVWFCYISSNHDIDSSFTDAGSPTTVISFATFWWIPNSARGSPWNRHMIAQLSDAPNAEMLRLSNHFYSWAGNRIHLRINFKPHRNSN